MRSSEVPRRSGKPSSPFSACGSLKESSRAIDARSSSRYGTFDFGTNASRVRGLMNDIEEAIRTQKPERPPAAAPAPAKKGAAGKKDQKK